jgi:hypothetical protein
MKLKTTLFILSSLALGIVSSSAATLQVTNVVNGPGDTLYASKENSLMTTGFVTLGYFVSTISQADIDTISELQTVLQTPSNYITVSSAVPGLVSSQVGDGYADAGIATDIGTITGVNPLLGRQLYSIVTNQLSLAAFANAVLDSTIQIALVNIGPIKDDSPVPNFYTSNPVSPATVVIGEYDTFTISDGSGLGNGNYATLKMDAIPEPSAALLGALGALGLLRRRRI